MRSLRFRLTAVVVGLSALALIFGGLAVYSAQRGFLLDRASGQARDVLEVAGMSLVPRPIEATRSSRRSDGPGPPFGPRPNRRFGVPTGTYAELRDTNDRRVAGAVLGTDTTIRARPSLPPNLQPGATLTVDGQRGAETRYRVATGPAPGGGTLITAVPLRDVDDSLEQLLAIQLIVIGVVLTLLAGLAWRLVGLGLRPLAAMGQTAEAIASGRITERVEDVNERTETGRLGLALNTMLDRLASAFAEQRASETRLRQFLADASHELRTPLTSIRGYAELHRMGALTSAADEAQAIRRIEEEAARMGVLVGDLLALARLDDVHTVPHADLDLAPLLADAAADTRATAPDRDVTVTAPPGLVVHGAADQLRQVLANLCANALAHTPPGTAVELSLVKVNDTAQIAVRDYGPGLPPGDPAKLFGRFWRAEGGRTRGAAGAGLGLAIVTAIAQAHGGEATAESMTDGGARFVVSLPLARTNAGSRAGNASQETPSSP